MSRRTQPFTLLDLVVTLGFTLGVTAASLGVLAAVSHTGRRDGVLAQLEGDAELAMFRLGQDLRRTTAVPQTQVDVTANVLSLDIPLGPNLDGTSSPSVLAPMLIVGLEPTAAGIVATVDVGPGANLPASSTAFAGFVVDGQHRAPVNLVVTGDRATGVLPPFVKPGAWLVPFSIVHWRLAATDDVSNACLGEIPCALYRLEDAPPPTDGPTDLPAHAAARASSSAGWTKVIEGVFRFDAKMRGPNGPVEVELEMRRQVRTGAAYTFKIRSAFPVRAGVAR